MTTSTELPEPGPLEPAPAEHGNGSEEARVRRGMRPRLFFLSLVVLTSVGCDQLSKSAAEQSLRGNPPRSFLGGSFRLLYAENPGAFLGLGGGLPDGLRFALLVIGAALIVAVAAWLLLKRLDAPLPMATGGALLVAGGVGNLIDRVFNDGRVVDFLHLRLGPLETGIFNVADVQLMIGAALLVLWSLKTGADDDKAVSPSGAGPPAATS